MSKIIVLALILVFRLSQAETLLNSIEKPESSQAKLATTIRLNTPEGIAVANEGSLYIADMKNHRIRKVDKQGMISTVAGDGTAGYHGDGGPAHLAQLNEPSGIAFDKHGNLYIADSKNHVIRKIDNYGIITTLAGNNTSGYSGDNGLALAAQFNLPVQVVIDSQDNLYITDQNNHVIRKINANGIITTLAGDGTKGYSE
ncbi:leucine-rich repeat-containing protein [Thioploca ingrica]|uniref:Leucine-rich repeat-containing protein n=1 Tax=Thioploca ingrica TaxID=40754 RepID=A0A090ACE9_9GAMM|nr:leucine-rich repeat-containing protein [Thioploca ingrica]